MGEVETKSAVDYTALIKKRGPGRRDPASMEDLQKTGILLLVLFVIFGVAFAAAADFGIDIHSEQLAAFD